MLLGPFMIDEDYIYGEDDLANESANVSELNHTETAVRAVNRERITDLT